MRPTLHDWAIVPSPLGPYDPPETVRQRLHGVVQGHERFEDGNQITTSIIKGKQGDAVVVASGNRYLLGEPSDDYERHFPNAKRRLFDSLPEIE